MTRDVLRDEEFRPEVLEAETVFEGRVWDVVRERFAFGGDELVREYQEHPGAVGVLAVDDRDRVLLIKQYRHPVRHRDWELPAGLLDVEGEPALETARRELAEEVDLAASDWELIADHFTSPGGSSERVVVYRATGLEPVEHDFARTGEEAELELRWVELEEAVEAVLDGRLRNGILQVGLLTEWVRRARADDGR